MIESRGQKVDTAQETFVFLRTRRIQENKFLEMLISIFQKVFSNNLLLKNLKCIFWVVKNLQKF